MAIYIPKCGQQADGLCGCGARAVTEVQVGYSHAVNGGQYEEFCEDCWGEYFSSQQSNALSEVARVETAVAMDEESTCEWDVPGVDCPQCKGTFWGESQCPICHPDSRLEESARKSEPGYDCPRCGGTSWPQEGGCKQCGPEEPEPRPVRVRCPRCCIGDLSFDSYCDVCREEVY